MARTILRDRSDDLVRSVQLADRTGIVAASAPKPADAHGDDEPIVVEFAPVSGQLDIALTPVMAEVPGTGEERTSLRQVRRNLVVAAAAVVLLGVGWLAGDTFGFDPGADKQAIVAGATPAAGPIQPVQPAPSSSAAPQVPVASTPPAVAPETSKTEPSGQKKTAKAAPSTSGSGEARTDPAEETTRQDKRFGQTIDEQIQQLLETWSWTRSDSGGGFDEGQDRSPRAFGPLGR